MNKVERRAHRGADRRRANAHTEKEKGLNTSMAGTYLQQDVYGLIPNASPRFDASKMNDHQLIGLLHSLPAVQNARKSCDWVVATSMYQPKVASLIAPMTNTSECWLAFLDREEHSAPGWTKIPIVLFDSWERNENIFKVMLPAVLAGQPLVYLNHDLPRSRCMSLAHMIRGKELAKGSPDQPHLLASAIPGWSGRRLMPGQIEITEGYLKRRNATSDLADLTEQLARMTRAGFNISENHRVTDTLWMIWPSGGEAAERMSRLWMHEVARFSSYEKISYPWAAAQVSGFKAYLTNAIYIYSPDQRTCGRPPSNASSTGGKSKSRRKLKSKPKSKRRLHQKRRRLAVL